MKNRWRAVVTRSIILACCLAGMWFFTGMVAAAQGGAAQDSCDVVHAAYNKSFRAESQMSTKNSGAVNVTKAQGEITGDGSYTESCKFLRDETLNGEAVRVYSDVMKSRTGTADARCGSRKPKAWFYSRKWKWTWAPKARANKPSYSITRRNREGTSDC